MIKNSFIAGIIFVLLSSCSTYTTFYGETVRTLDVDTKTRRLDVSYQDLKEFPVSFEKLETLRMLNLSGNTQLDIPEILASLPHPEKLEILVLDSLQLKKIPEVLSDYKNLKQLSLAYNPTLAIEETITVIEELPLEFLNLKGNQLTQLPEAITHLKTLKDLNLSYNKVHDENSYTYLGALPNLYSLWLDHNYLAKLPKTIGAIDQITYFYIDNNALTFLPQEMENMTGLRVLHAGYNKFTELPERFIKMPSLIMVHINNNQITSFPRKYEVEKYAMLALLLDHNPLPEEERLWAEKTFKKFFLLSFEQTF
mgnify:CR=1 FL=1